MPRSKPFPDVYLAAAQALGVDPARCAIVEDTVTGATAGVAAGATVFGYSPGEPATAAHRRCAMWACRTCSRTCGNCRRCFRVGGRLLPDAPDPIATMRCQAAAA